MMLVAFDSFASAEIAKPSRLCRLDYASRDQRGM